MANLVELFDNIVQMQNLNGVPLAYGKMYVYALGRTRLMDTWSDVDGSSLNTNPIILDNAGQCHCYVSDAFDYTIVVCDAYDNEIFSLDKYLYSDGSHSHADVAMAPSESIAVSSYQVGETTVYVPYLTGEIGKVYTGIDPVNVDNVNDTISVSHVGLGLQDPLYFVEDSETACIIGCSAQTEIPSATSGKWEDAADTVIANSAQWGEDTTYEAGSYVDITDNTISVTGLQPSGDYADSTALDTKLDTTAFSDVSGSFITAVDIPESANWNSTYETVSTNSAGWTSTPQIPVTGINGIKISESGDLVVFEVSADYATESFVNDAVDSAVSGKLDSATYAAQSGNFYLTSNPSGYITGVPSSYLQNSDLTIVDNKITEISGIELSAGDEFPQSATEAIEVVTTNSGDWNTVTAKLDKADSGNFYPMDGNPSGFLTTETDWSDTITAASSYAYEQATAAIPQPQDLSYISGKVDDLSSNKLDSTAFSTVSGSFITAHQELPESATWNTVTSKLDSTAFSTVSGSFLTSHQSLAESANWNSTYNTVYDNSASWTGGGATLPVSGSAGANSAVYDLYDMKLEYNLTSDGGSEPEHTYVQIGTNAITTYESYDNDQSHNEVNIYPGYIEFYNDVEGYVDFAGYDVTNWNSTYETVRDNSGSWTGGGGSTYTGDAQGALDEVYLNSANWNETYSAVSSHSADWTGGGADYTAGAGIDITNDVISVTGKENTITYGYSGDAISSLNGHAIISDSIPYEVYGISASANISAYESDSALWISGRDWTPELNNKLDTTAFSTVSGNFLTAHQSLPQSANWNSTYNTVHDNSASWTGGGGVEYSGISPIVVNNTSHEISADTWGLAIGDGLSAVEDAVNKQTIISVTGGGTTYTGDAQGALDEVYTNSGTWNTVTDKLDTTAQVVTAVGSGSVTTTWPYITTTYLVSSINGSAILPYGYSILYSNSANWNSTYNTVHDNSASWTGGEAQVVTATGTATIFTGGFLPQTVITSINSLAILPYGYSILSSNSANWNSTYNTVSTNSGNWNSTYNTVSTNSGSWSAKYSGDNMISIANDKVSFSSQAGITDIVSATALPATPVSTVLYLIPEA